MLNMSFSLLFAWIALLPTAFAHIALFHPSMYGFNVTGDTNTPAFPNQDNRPVAPLFHRKFHEWWHHGHLDYPPHENDILEMPVGKTTTVELNCDKGGTSWWNSSAGSKYQQHGNGNDPCPGETISAYHTTGVNDLAGCALAVAYKSDAKDVNQDDFTVFSVQHQCVWTRFTDFAIPAKMPACPNGKCTCAWFWIHNSDSGGEQNYMTSFQCSFPGASSTAPVAKPKLARRCGADPQNGRPHATPSNCTVGAKAPFYWMNDNSNMFEGYYAPPVYNDLYNFKNGAQDDIFEDSDTSGGYYPYKGPSNVAQGTSVAPRPSSRAAIVATSTKPLMTTSTTVIGAHSSQPAVAPPIVVHHTSSAAPIVHNPKPTHRPHHHKHKGNHHPWYSHKPATNKPWKWGRGDKGACKGDKKAKRSWISRQSATEKVARDLISDETLPQ